MTDPRIVLSEFIRRAGHQPDSWSLELLANIDPKAPLDLSRPLVFRDRPVRLRRAP